MPKFVPVINVEAPRSEQHISQNEFSKHRKFDQSSQAITNRGWEMGNVGWGVLGAHGSHEKDTGAQVVKKTDATGKMIKNEKGLWVKAKDFGEKTDIGGAGRGNGIPVLSGRSEIFQSRSTVESTPVYDRDNFEERERKDSREREKGRFERGRSRERKIRHGDAEKEEMESRGRERDRDSVRGGGRERDRPSSTRKERSRSRSKSRSRSRSRTRHREVRRRGKSREKEGEREGERERRGHDKGREKRDSISTERQGPRRIEKQSQVRSPRREVEEKEEEEGEGEGGGRVGFSISAIQVVERLSEVYSDRRMSDEERLDGVESLFSPLTQIFSLKSRKQVISGLSALRTSFARTRPSSVLTSRRVFVEPLEEGGKREGEEGRTDSFCLDLHTAGTSPGLGDRAKDGILLYLCRGPLILSVWGQADSESLCSAPSLTWETLRGSRVWTAALDIIKSHFHVESIPEDKIHFHDYSQMETWG